MSILVNACKYIGVFFDRRLTFIIYTKYPFEKATKTQCILYPVPTRKSSLSLKLKINIHFYILDHRPTIIYTDECWNFQLAKSNWLKLEKIRIFAFEQP